MAEMTIRSQKYICLAHRSLPYLQCLPCEQTAIRSHLPTRFVARYWRSIATSRFRRALGAQRSDILSLVAGEIVRLTLTGVVLGIAGAFAMTRLLKDLLFQVRATDPATFVGISILFVLVGVSASCIPARRAAKVDPMVALRYE